MKYKLLLERILDNLTFKDIKNLGEDLKDESDDGCEEFGGASVYRSDKELDEFADYLGNYMEEHYPKELNEGLDR